MTGNLRPYLRAMGGAALSSLGYAMFRARCKKLARNEDEDYHEKAWGYAQEIGWLLKARALYANRFQVGWENLVIAELYRNNPEDALSTKRLSEVQKTLKGGGKQTGSPGSIVLCAHSELPPCLVAAMTAVGQPPVCIRRRIIRADKAKAGTRRTDLIGGPEVIPPDKGVFIRVRKLVRSGRIVLLLPDFTRRMPWSLKHGHYVSTAMIEFALRTNIDLIFGSVTVTKEGRVEVSFERPAPCEGAASVENIMEQFRAFTRRTSNAPANWQVVKSPANVLRLKKQAKTLAVLPEV